MGQQASNKKSDNRDGGSLCRKRARLFVITPGRLEKRLRQCPVNPGLAMLDDITSESEVWPPLFVQHEIGPIATRMHVFLGRQQGRSLRGGRI
jgi:hypothetical protein